MAKQKMNLFLSLHSDTPRLLFIHLQFAEEGLYRDVWRNNIQDNPKNIYTYARIMSAIERVQTEPFVFIEGDRYLGDLLLENRMLLM